MRNLILAMTLGLVVTSCGGSGQAGPPTSTTAENTAVETSGPTAPDFDLALADGTTFSLAAVDKPVYMVFWAEW